MFPHTQLIAYITADILFERYFRCEDLGRDLVPVVQEYKASSECATGEVPDRLQCPR